MSLRDSKYLVFILSSSSIRESSWPARELELWVKGKGTNRNVLIVTREPELLPLLRAATEGYSRDLISIAQQDPKFADFSYLKRSRYSFFTRSWFKGDQEPLLALLARVLDTEKDTIVSKRSRENRIRKATISTTIVTVITIITAMSFALYESKLASDRARKLASLRVQVENIATGTVPYAIDDVHIVEELSHLNSRDPLVTAAVASLGARPMGLPSTSDSERLPDAALSDIESPGVITIDETSDLTLLGTIVGKVSIADALEICQMGRGSNDMPPVVGLIATNGSIGVFQQVHDDPDKQVLSNLCVVHQYDEHLSVRWLGNAGGTLESLDSVKQVVAMDTGDLVDLQTGVGYAKFLDEASDTVAVFESTELVVQSTVNNESFRQNLRIPMPARSGRAVMATSPTQCRSSVLFGHRILDDGAQWRIVRRGSLVEDISAVGGTGGPNSCLLLLDNEKSVWLSDGDRRVFTNTEMTRSSDAERNSRRGAQFGPSADAIGYIWNGSRADTERFALVDRKRLQIWSTADGSWQLISESSVLPIEFTSEERVRVKVVRSYGIVATERSIVVVHLPSGLVVANAVVPGLAHGPRGRDPLCEHKSVTFGPDLTVRFEALSKECPANGRMVWRCPVCWDQQDATSVLSAKAAINSVSIPSLKTQGAATPPLFPERGVSRSCSKLSVDIENNPSIFAEMGETQNLWVTDCDGKYAEIRVDPMGVANGNVLAHILEYDGVDWSAIWRGKITGGDTPCTVDVGRGAFRRDLLSRYSCE